MKPQIGYKLPRDNQKKYHSELIKPQSDKTKLWAGQKRPRNRHKKPHTVWNHKDGQKKPLAG